MHPKPDIIRTLLFVFALGLAVTGVTTMQAAAGNNRDANTADVETQNGVAATSQSPISARDD